MSQKLAKNLASIENDTMGRISNIARKNGIRKGNLSELENLNKEYFSKVSSIIDKASKTEEKPNKVNVIEKAKETILDQIAEAPAEAKA